MGESGTSHDLCHSDALHTLAPDCSGGFGEDAGASVPCGCRRTASISRGLHEWTLAIILRSGQLLSGCRHTPSCTLRGPTCVDMTDIIQPPMDRRRFSPDEEVAPRAWAGLAVVATALFVTPSTRWCSTSPSAPSVATSPTSAQPRCRGSFPAYTIVLGRG